MRLESRQQYDRRLDRDIGGEEKQGDSDELLRQTLLVLIDGLELPDRLTTCEDRADVAGVSDCQWADAARKANERSPTYVDRAAAVRVGRSQEIRPEDKRQSSEPHIDT